MSAPVTNCTGFLPNASVFGIGVRVNVYVIGILAALYPVKWNFSIDEGADNKLEYKHKHEISRVVTAQGLNGMGLLVAAWVETDYGNLSLYHAFLILNLLFYLSTSFVYFLFNPGTVFRRRDLYVMFFLLLAVSSLYVGLNASTFGSQPECNDTVKIVWIFHVRTASFSWFRTFGIVVFAIYMTVIIFHLIQLGFMKRRPFLSLAAGKAMRTYGLIVFSVNLMLIAVIETMIKANNVTDNTWNFGQVLAIVMLFGTLCDVWDDNEPLRKLALEKARGARFGMRDTRLMPISSDSPRKSRSMYSSLSQ